MFDKTTLIAYVDVIMQLLVIMTACAIINIKSVEQGDIKSLSKYMIIMTWETESTDDVDIFVKDPYKNLVWFQHKDGKIFFLDRDDTGSSHTTMLVDGELKGVSEHREVVYIKDTLEGLYIINVFMYRKSEPTPTNVKIQIIQISPYAILEERNLTFTATGQEQTAVVLEIDKQGNIINRFYEFYPLVNEVLRTAPTSPGGL